MSSMSVEAMKVDEVSQMLKDKGVPDKFCEVFEENFVDGEAFKCIKESDIKEMVPPIGIVKKILRIQNDCFTLPALPSPSSLNPLNPERGDDDISIGSSSSIWSSSESPPSEASTMPRARDREILTIPTSWRPEIQDCITDEMLDISARNEIVRTLVNILFTCYSSPTRAQCSSLARRLILQYGFMKDDQGSGYQTWEDKMVERVRNVIKCARKKRDREDSSCPKQKKQKMPLKRGQLLRRYPIGVTRPIEDIGSFGEHMKALSIEMEKANPRDTIILPLMKSTYSKRRTFIEAEAVSVQEVLKECHAALKRPAALEQEMGLVTGCHDVKQTFINNWKLFVPAIMRYARKNKGKKGLSTIFETLDDTVERHADLGPLSFLGVLVAKMLDDALIYLYQEFSMDTSLTDAIQREPVRNSPRIIALCGAEITQYFVVVERIVLCEAPSIPSALFYTFSAYYVFNLEYPKKAAGIFYFLQDYILAYPDSLKRPATYLSVVSDIKSQVKR
ncbi:uncharacterized protein LOC135344490 isoform X1 [Halichondria panicea]|uniref:uncharacterized protein LOC135331128 n=1 Tax=Halichondria panicea TaxID=6063 RepID=UPI00312B392C